MVNNIVFPVAQEKRLLEWHKAYDSNKMHHAWLLSGVKNLGKLDFAYYIAAFIFANNNKDSMQSMFNEELDIFNYYKDYNYDDLITHNPALFTLQREVDENGKQAQFITIKNIRNLQAKLSMKSDGNFRVVIVDSIDNMNINAANAFLKLLEEPPSKVIFLLISHNHKKLLPTIISRCRTLKFSLATKEELATLYDKSLQEFEHVNEVLSAVSKEEVLYLSEGRAKFLQELITSDKLATWQQVKEVWQHCYKKDYRNIQKAIEELSKTNKNNSFSDFLSFWLVLQHSILKYYLNKDKLAFFKNLFDNASLNKLVNDKRETFITILEDTHELVSELQEQALDKKANLNRLFYIWTREIN